MSQGKGCSYEGLDLTSELCVMSQTEFLDDGFAYFGDHTLKSFLQVDISILEEIVSENRRLEYLEDPFKNAFRCTLNQVFKEDKQVQFGQKRVGYESLDETEVEAYGKVISKWEGGGGEKNLVFSNGCFP